MNKSIIVTATAVILVAAGSVASAAAEFPMSVFMGPNVSPVVRHTPGMEALYNQNSQGNYYYVNSQNYTSGSYTSYDDQAADDFIVPQGQTWTVKEVDVTGCCSGTPNSENVYFYKDKSGVPGRLVKSGLFSGLHGIGSPSFAIYLGKTGVKLKAGHYWVSVVANCSDAGGCGEWGWETTFITNNDLPAWRQPGDGSGTGCTSWNTAENCFSNQYLDDLLFELQGKSK